MKEELTGIIDGDQATLRYYKKNIRVELKVNIPYPKTFNFNQEASSLGTAINRSVAAMRKQLKGKRITEVWVHAIKA